MHYVDLGFGLSERPTGYGYAVADHVRTVGELVDVERLVPAGISRRLSPAEMDHYRMVQPTPEARVGVAVLPKQIFAARPPTGMASADAKPNETRANE